MQYIVHYYKKNPMTGEQEDTMVCITKDKSAAHDYARRIGGWVVEEFT